MKYNLGLFREDIVRCINLCKTELDNRKNGIIGESSVEQIENTILPELNHVLERINTGKIPDLNDRYLVSFACAFKTWGWNMQRPTELYIQLVNLNNNYKKI